MKLTLYDREILLHQLWKSRELFSRELITMTGKSVEVIFPGVQNLDSGPDFREVVLKLDDHLLRGDVEMHWQESGWHLHGHHRDSRYNQVVLHVVCTPPGKPHVVREDGVEVEQLFVEAELALKMEPDGSSLEQVATDVQIVEDCPLSEDSADKIFATLDIAGAQRIQRKVEQFREELTSATWDQITYKKIMESLGYSKNRPAFRRLAELVPFSLIRSEMQWVSPEMAEQKCAALLFGAAGLLPEVDARINMDRQHPYVANLQQTWRRLSHRLALKSMRPEEWQFFRLRPFNFPTRRLAGAVQILARLHSEGVLGSILAVFRAYVDRPKLLRRELERLFVVQATGFWERHYQFAEPSASTGERPSSLVGRQRSRDVVFNTILPAMYVYGSGSNDGKLLNALKELWQNYPVLAENAVTRAMRKQLFDSDRKQAPHSAMVQQGLIHLHTSYCRDLLCRECALLCRHPGSKT